MAAVAASWGYIRGWLDYVRSILVVTRSAVCWEETLLELYRYADRELWVPRLGRREYKFGVFMDRDRRTSLVVAENMFRNRSFLAFRKGVPLWITVAVDSFSVTYVRGTFNLPAFYAGLRRAQAERTVRMHADDEAPDRFYVDHLWGSLIEEPRGSSVGKSPLASGLSGGSVFAEKAVEEGLSSNFPLNPALVESGGVRLLVGPESEDEIRLGDHSRRRRECGEWLDALWLSSSQKALVEDVRFWLESKDWYEERKIPWKRGMLLTGAPGTGKSSFVFALARKFKLPVEVVHLNTMNNYDLTQAWHGREGGVIRLIEDIDGVFDGRRNIHESKHRSFLTFDTLLNTLDGVDQSQGVLTIVTTNHPEKLDPALGGGSAGISSRPGRIDQVVEFGLLDEAGRRFVTESVLDPMSDSEWEAYRGEWCPRDMSGAEVRELAVREALRRKWSRQERRTA